MTDVSGIPNMGFGGGAFYGGSGLGNAYANQAQTNQYLAQQQAQLAQANSYNPWANTPGGFGAQTAYYAGQGAAYDRAVQPKMGSVFETGAKPFNHYGGVGGLQLFDPNKYLSQNRDVWEAGADPWEHYNQFGAKEGRQGTFGDFNSSGYLAQNPDVAASGMDPTAHWFNFGQKEGRQGSGFEPWLGVSNQPAQPQQQQWAHTPDWDQYFNTATASDADQSRNTLAAEYYLANPDVYKAAQQAGGDKTAYGLNHLMAFGQDEGRTFFDTNKYRQDNPDVAAAGMDPTGHWFQFGQKEGRAAPMSSVFNKETYNLLNPDVAAAGMNPLQHWLTYGQKENRMGGAFENTGSYFEFPGTTYRDPWIASIPEARRTAETVNTIKNLSAKYGWDPAALAAVITLETRDNPQSLWNTKAHNNTYYGLTQMGPDTWKDQKTGKLGGMTWQQYQNATPAQQIAMYGSWLDNYARPDNAAGLVKGGIGTLPPEMQAAIMMGTQFGPNKTEWVKALGEGNMSVPTSTKQAPQLAPWTIEAMRDEMARTMMAWPQNQSPWPLQ